MPILSALKSEYLQHLITTSRAEGKRWLAVDVSGSAAVAGAERASSLAVVLRDGRRIEVGRGFDAGTLQRLLAVVERG